MIEGIAKGSNTKQKYIFGRKNMNYVEPSKAQETDSAAVSNFSDDFDNTDHHYTSFEDKVRDVVVGQKIESINGSKLTLGNGTVLELEDGTMDHEFSAGAYGEWVPAVGDNAGITDIHFSEWSDEEHSLKNTMSIVVLHENETIAEAQCEAYAEGEWYMGVLNLVVKTPNGETFEDTVLKA